MARHHVLPCSKVADWASWRGARNSAADNPPV